MSALRVLGVLLSLLGALGCQQASDEDGCDRVCSCAGRAGGPSALAQCQSICGQEVKVADDPRQTCIDELKSRDLDQCVSECQAFESLAVTHEPDARVAPPKPDAYVYVPPPDARPDAYVYVPPPDARPDAYVPPPPSPRSTMTWNVTDSCMNGERIQLRFFDRLAGEQWPIDTTKIYPLQPGESFTYTLSCLTGDKICYGANQVTHKLYWGTGLDDTQACEGCCRTCSATSVVPTTLYCD